MNLEAALKVVDEKWGECKRGPIGEVLRALCSEPTPIKIEDLRIGMRVRTKDGKFTITALDIGNGPQWWYAPYSGRPLSDILEILP